MNRKQKILIFIVALLAAALVFFIFARAKQAEAPQNSGKEGSQTICTMDAKICPDGSSVGRTGPDCEFSPCPGDEPAKMNEEQ